MAFINKISTIPDEFNNGNFADTVRCFAKYKLENLDVNDLTDPIYCVEISFENDKSPYPIIYDGANLSTVVTGSQAINKLANIIGADQIKTKDDTSIYYLHCPCWFYSSFNDGYIIAGEFTNVVEVLNSIPLPCCRVGYGGNCIFFSEQALLALIYRMYKLSVDLFTFDSINNTYTKAGAKINAAKINSIINRKEAFDNARIVAIRARSYGDQIPVHISLFAKGGFYTYTGDIIALTRLNDSDISKLVKMQNLVTELTLSTDQISKLVNDSSYQADQVKLNLNKDCQIELTLTSNDVNSLLTNKIVTVGRFKVSIKPIEEVTSTVITVKKITSSSLPVLSSSALARDDSLIMAIKNLQNKLPNDQTSDFVNIVTNLLNTVPKHDKVDFVNKAYNNYVKLNKVSNITFVNCLRLLVDLEYN